ncbi:MAG: hypothetical protein AAB388_03785 [Patescibacteria group bacterium]
MMNRHHRQSGAAMLLFVLFFAFAASAMMFALNQSIFADLSDFNQLVRSKQSMLASESGAEDVVYRLVFGTFSVGNTEVLSLLGVGATTTTAYDSVADVYTITSQATKDTVVRKSEAVLSIGAGSAFNYGLQAGNGGITLSNGSDIYGNVYSNGPVIGAGTATIFGDIVSADAGGLIQTISATGSVFANTIDHIDADGDAHYNVQIGTNAQNPVGGIRYTPATNQPLVPLPIDDATVDTWKQSIIDYGTTITAADPLCLSGTYTIDTNVTIGYLKVECNLDIKKTGASTIVTLDGPIWVQGNLSFTQGPTLQVDPALGRRSVQMIADDPSNRLTSSQIEIRNSTNFAGSGDSRSYIMLLSMNESASVSGSEIAINVSQSANGDVLAYAGNGLIEIGNNIDLREVTGYQIDVANGSSITYESGLASLLFTSGPGGGYVLDDWQQIE